MCVCNGYRKIPSALLVTKFPIVSSPPEEKPVIINSLSYGKRNSTQRSLVYEQGGRRTYFELQNIVSMFLFFFGLRPQ